MPPAEGQVPKLFQPVTVGDMRLAHRVVMAPLTRCRANNRHVHGDLAVEYYAQRASVPGTLLITEATYIAPQTVGHPLGPTLPGIWSDEQIAAWKKVVDAVHARGSFIYLQIWALGRGAKYDELKKEDPDLPYVAPSAIPLKGSKEAPQALTIPEIREYVQLFAQAASNAVWGAGFDGVEIHGANGYLVDEFIQDVSNQRTDEYGGSIENRCRFALQVVEAVSQAVGAKKTAIRLSPWSSFQDMRMGDPIPTFSYLVTRIRETFPDLSYLHVVEPGVGGGSDIGFEKEDVSRHFTTSRR